MKPLSTEEAEGRDAQSSRFIWDPLPGRPLADPPAPRSLRSGAPTPPGWTLSPRLCPRTSHSRVISWRLAPPSGPDVNSAHAFQRNAASPALLPAAAPGLIPAAGAMSEPPRDAHPIPRGSKACRRLFGPVDSEQLQRDCDALMASCVQEARERWNFDFVTETPLEGDFAWERVRGLGFPKLYLSSGPRGAQDSLGGSKRPSGSPALLQGTTQEDHVDLSLSCTLVPRSPEPPEGSPSTSQGRKRRQTSMTDFYHSKRRLIFSKRRP
ncbi:cyclin-dependent kinase inhibitor 1 isoform X1 [Saccopteryx bilineata]|uniref:cyclin-dependent kinase inhibitor 1 isoform X1 n=2 Tax=Saccopteryx bilineata TaxID=59482 RepID=UPI00338DAE31